MAGMVDSFLLCELRALSAVRVEPGAARRSSLCDEVKPLDTDRSIRTAADPTASGARVLAAAAEGRSAPAKVTVTRPAASDEPLGPFSAAVLVTPFFTVLDIQGHGVLTQSPQREMLRF